MKEHSCEKWDKDDDLHNYDFEYCPYCGVKLE